MAAAGVTRADVAAWIEAHPSKRKPAAIARGKAIKRLKPVGTNCKHFGPATGEQVECAKGCRGPMANVHACAVHGKCTVLKSKADGLTYCAGGCDKGELHDPPQPRPVSTSILLTGGIGDVLALEAMMSDAQRAALETIYYACPSVREIMSLFPALPNYPRLKHHIILPTGSKIHHSRDSVDRLFTEVAADDWSIGEAFPRADLKYNGSSFLAHRVAEPPQIDGPYGIIVDVSTFGKMPRRDFDAADWQACLATLEAWGLRSVVLSREPCDIPSHPLLSQMQLPILQAIEAIKGASGYVGIDSWASILAAKLFPADRLRIKSISGNFYKWGHIYTAPRQDFAAVVSQAIPMPEGLVMESAVHPHHPDERAELFQAHDGGSIEVEFGELIASLVRAYKPAHVLETGTFLGVAAKSLSLACSRNGFGDVTTLEADGNRARLAAKSLAAYKNVRVVNADSLAWLRAYTGPQFGLIVLDSELATRVKELEIIRDRKLATGPVFVHDTSRLRAAGGMADCPEFGAKLDALGIPCVECHLSRGWRLFDLAPPSTAPAPAETTASPAAT